MTAKDHGPARFLDCTKRLPAGWVLGYALHLDENLAVTRVPVVGVGIRVGINPGRGLGHVVQSR